MTSEQMTPLLFTVFRDDIRRFVGNRWRSFRRARTADLRILTQRSLGPYNEKHSLPSPMARENFRTLIALAPLAAFSPLLKSHPEFLLPYRIVSLAIVGRLFLVLAIFIGYRAKLLPRVLVNSK